MTVDHPASEVFFFFFLVYLSSKTWCKGLKTQIISNQQLLTGNLESYFKKNTEWGWSQKVQTSSYKISPRDVMHSMVTAYLKIAKTVDLKSLHHKKKRFFSLCVVTDIN